MKLFANAIVLAFFVLAAGASGAPQRCETLGHRAYEEAPASDLQSVGTYRKTKRTVLMQSRAAAAFRAMREAAQLEGVALVPISGFRSYSYQKDLFSKAVKKFGSEQRAARWVAPAGCSEHHTGLALDLGDLSRPDCDTKSCFEKTKAYSWLLANAQRFGLQQSFTAPDAPVAFEPWHWRYVGEATTRQSLGLVTCKN